MAAASTSGMAVLRIKRKRTDDPLNALVVHDIDLKKTKVLNGDSSSNNIFRYSGTVDDTQVDKTKHTVKNFQTIYQQVVRHDGEAEKGRAKRRETSKAHQKLSRYRIVTENRTDVESVNESPSLSEENVMEQLYKIYDVIAEDNNNTDEMFPRESQVASKDEKILCNNVEMIREKLNISEKFIPIEEEEYVYDLYLAPGGAIVMHDNQIINVEECQKDDYDYAIGGGEVNTDECFDDEDDENDENNWRNEYPEDDSHSSEDDDDGDHSGGKRSSSDEEDYVYSRYRQGNDRLKFDPYAPNLQEDYYYTVADDDPDNET